MRINNDLLGKVVIDESGDHVGFVKEVEWDSHKNRVTSIILKEVGISTNLGLGKNQLIPYENIENIGDKVLIKGRLFPSK